MKKSIFFLLIALGFILIIAIIYPIKTKRQKIQRESIKTKVYQMRIKEEKEKNDKLKNEILSINEKNNIEKISRENLNMGKKGEKVYIFLNDEDDDEKENK
ncbi:septum formation initiator family protein [Oceanivirga miroungae]|uniref:Cell division protein FtsB n=1 Tax=Oceanivirga miroungae TaxID=1130046 RepID=A0A6I8MDL1_9FUSO|nr:septum formation initiator family protein [Oceanivirga miroungae]VWL85254.1 Cell division protein FtsB [Oceanivirga miroungae]